MKHIISVICIVLLNVCISSAQVIQSSKAKTQQTTSKSQVTSTPKTNNNPTEIEQMRIIVDEVEVEEVEVNRRDDDDYGTEVQVVDLSADSRSSDKEADSDQIFTVVEQQPEFPGGDAALMNYIKKNLKYPAEAAKNGIPGRVTLSFIVEKDGSISNIEIMRSPAEEFSSEAIRVVQSMPKWKPGKQRGKAVRVKYVLPVTFRQ